MNPNVDQGNGTPIAFRTVTNKTRTTEMDKDNIGDFKVSTIKSSSTSFDFADDVMNGMAVIRGINANTWSYSPIKFYPDVADVSFFAYSPSGSVNVTKFEGQALKKATIAYTVPTSNADAKKAEDFLVASTNVVKDDYDENVILTFKHALSLATFEAVNANDGATFIVEKIEFSNMGNSSTLTADAATAATSTFSWAQPAQLDQNKTYAVSLPEAGISILPNGNGKLTPEKEGLMILPQEIIGTTRLIITFRAIDGEYKDIYESGSVKEFEIPTNVAAPALFTFAMNTRYHFKFTFDALNDIKFEVKMSPWETDQTVPVPTP
ncbi:hypothetical protein JCM10512_2783 [Bacteroides reticulotermitis JCM 10512]|uniref:Fimbrillin family protein n=1 Tax=Bacteroides reticulotermitis JCM 10512 TaxID=1445607 RepID=W4UVC1_9BACE|nr:hypothetical protein JCM10512_2783 [Bacteroides reticulotermitis JCM 10512]